MLWKTSNVRGDIIQRRAQNAEQNTNNKPRNIKSIRDGDKNIVHQFPPERTEVHHLAVFQRAKHRFGKTSGTKVRNLSNYVSSQSDNSHPRRLRTQKRKGQGGLAIECQRISQKMDCSRIFRWKGSFLQDLRGCSSVNGQGELPNRRRCAHRLGQPSQLPSYRR